MAHRSLRVAFLVLALASVFSASAFWASSVCAQGRQCFQIFDSVEAWKPVPGSLYMGIRTNPRHYWSIARSDLKGEDSDILKFQGVVVGDPNPGNFGDSKIAGRRRFVVVDVDDGGVAPFVLDIARYAIGLKGGADISLEKIIDAYVDGVRGKKRDEPGAMSKALEISEAKEAERDHEYLDRVTVVTEDGLRFHHHRAKLSRLDEGTIELNRLFQRVRPLLERELPEGKTLDIGWRMKAVGGSAGLPRFWFLRYEPKSGVHVYEFKLMAEPAVAAWGPQVAQVERLASITKIYREDARDDHFKVVTVPRASGGEVSFWMRPRVKDGLDLDLETGALTTGKEREQNEVLEYIAYWMGLRHGAQSPAYRDWMESKDNRKRFSQFSESWAERYLKLAARLHESSSATR